jgi:diacylglycerol kinase (ATP)
MKAFIQRHTISFKYAFEGLFWAFRTQPNFRIHFTLSALAILAGLFFGITRTEMLIIIFTILLGLMGEMINTSLEAMTDLISTEWHKEAKIAKDVGAGMMLLAAIGAVIIAVYIFTPYIIGSVIQ